MLAAVVIALIGFGVVMVYSASAIEAAVQLKDPQFYLKKQGFYAVVALGLMWVTSHVDYHRYRRHTYPIFALVTGFMPGILPIIILTTLLTAVVNNRLESRRIRRELEKEGLE